MDKQRLLRVLPQLNPWWNDGEVQSSLLKNGYRRRDFYALKNRIGERPVTTVCGPRQVGKTTLIGQLIQDLLTSERVEPTRVLYLSAEASALRGSDGSLVADTLDVYEQHFLGRAFTSLENPVYVLIDEVQKTEGWDETLKFYVDTCPEMIFVVTGSVSTLVQESASETLVGRVQRQTVVPFKFSDVARYHGELDDIEGRLESRELRESLRESLYSDDSEQFTEALNHAIAFLSETEPVLRSRLNEYLVKGGYPGVIPDDPSEALARLDEDLQRVVTGDLTTTFSVEKPETAFKILRYFADSTGSQVSINRISNQIGVTRNTVENYVDYLEQFFLVYRSPHYTGSSKPARKQPMAYVSDAGHLNALLGVSPDASTTPEDRGVQLETVVCDHLRRLQHYLSDRRNSRVEHYNKMSEVDFIVSGNDYTLPVEVKNGDSRDRSLKGLKQFVRNEGLDFGLAVNGARVLEAEENVIHVPAWLFLYLC